MKIIRQFVCLIFLTFSANSFAQQVLQIAAASDLKFALDEIVATYKKETSASVKATYGSSGNFRLQIAQGAPFQLFLSADESYVLALAKEGRTVDEGTLYAIGRIVLFAPHGSVLKAGDGMKALGDALSQGAIQKLAIANPEHAPYGRAAREALLQAGLWTAVQPKLVLGENVSQAAQFATSSGIQGGIFAYSLALSPSVANLGTFALIPESAHQPLKQRMVLLKNATSEAHAFYRYLQQPSARSTFKRFGFTLPGE
jgi:molybdate transport system substrate-binding protein